MGVRVSGPRRAALAGLALVVLLSPMPAFADVQSQAGPNSQPVPIRLNLQISATQEGSVVAWQAVPGASRYVVHRWKRLGNRSRCCELHVPVGTALRHVDAPLPGAGTYLYRVVAHLQSGRRGYEERTLQIAALANPRDFVATQTGAGIVSLTWTRPAGASYYRLSGPGVGVDGARHTASHYTASGVPEGRQEWQLVAYYAPGAVSDPQNPSRAVLVVQRQQPPAGVAAVPGSPVTDAGGSSPPLATIDNPNPPGDILQRRPPETSLPSAAPTNPPPSPSAPAAENSPAPTGGAPLVDTPRRDHRISVPLQAGAPAENHPAGGAPPPAASGRYLVTVTGLRAGSVTTDNMLHEDGKGDEVFAAAFVRRYDRRTASVVETTNRQTMVYGDVLRRLSERVQAGGGIQAGDQIFYQSTPPGVSPQSALPLTIWEGDLYPDDVLVIRPAVFESDRDEGGRYSAFAGWHRNVTTRVYQGDDHQQPLWQLTHELSVPSILTDLTRNERGGILTGIPMWEQGQPDQKIGPDWALVFDQGKIERFFQYGLAPQFTFRGSPSGHYSAGGRYTVRMKVERLPDSPVQAVRR